MDFLTLSDVTVQYPYGVDAVSGLSLTCKKGNTAVILSCSEGGKTTLLKAIAGLVPISSGSMNFGDITNEKATVRDRNVCLLFENQNFFKYRTLYKNLEYPLKLRKVADREISERINHVTERLDIKHLLKVRFNRLTAKQRVFASFSRVLLRDAGIYLFDNPFSGICQESRGQLFKQFLPYIKELEAKSIVVFATDSIAEAEALGGDITLLNYGIVLQQGAYAQIKSNPFSITAFNFFYGRTPQKTEILRKNDRVYLILNEEEITIDPEKLINPLYIGKSVYADFSEEGQLKIYDQRSEQLIYFN